MENSVFALSSPSLKLVGGLFNHHSENSASLPLVTWIAFPPLLAFRDSILNFLG